MPSVRSAKIALPSRVELDAEIANLSESSVFVKTLEPLHFGDRVQLTLFNVPVRATVAFVSGDPRGAVLVFTAPPPLLDQIAMNVREVEVLSPSAEAQHDPWLDGLDGGSDPLDPRTEPGLNKISDEPELLTPMGLTEIKDDPEDEAPLALTDFTANEPDGLQLDILPPELDPDDLARVDPTNDVPRMIVEDNATDPSLVALDLDPPPQAAVSSRPPSAVARPAIVTPLYSSPPQVPVQMASALNAPADLAARALSRASSGSRGMPAAQNAEPQRVPSSPPINSAPQRLPSPAPPRISSPESTGAQLREPSVREQPPRPSAPQAPQPSSKSAPRPASARPPTSRQEPTLGDMLDEVRRDLGSLTPVPSAPAPIVLTSPQPPQPSRPRSPSAVGMPAPSPPRIAAPRTPSLTPPPVLAPSSPPAIAPSPTPPSGTPDLPSLEGDGVTLRFGTSEQYRAQHKANIAHGGIIARTSVPLPIGTQKFLGIEIPGKERYTISARVTFIGEGTVGFVIDSFPIHKAQLKTFAEA